MAASNDTPRSFAILPLEIRRMIYNLVLPHDDTSTKWAYWPGDANKAKHWERCTDIFLVNRQVNKEAAAILYRDNWHTITTGPGNTYLNNKVSLQIVDNGHASIPSALSLVRDWQIEVYPFWYFPSLSSPTDDDRKHAIYAQDGWDMVMTGVERCAQILSNIRDLRNLKIRLPGHCHTHFSEWKVTLVFWTEFLQPLMRFRSRIGTTFVVSCVNGPADPTLQCQRTECRLVRKGLQKHKDAIDEGEIAIEDGNVYEYFTHLHNKYRWDRNGYGYDGLDKDGYDGEGYDEEGYDRDGYNKNYEDRNGRIQDDITTEEQDEGHIDEGDIPNWGSQH
ncbi:MAG: hypothetical protein Q9218_004208 [Villophora microphyllina]